MPHIKLTLAYDGTAYHGSQVQPGVPTIQGELEKALMNVRAFSTRTVFAGRTDAGVHAIGQVVSTEVDWQRPLDRLRGSLNALLPSDIRVLWVEPVPPGFNARFDARSREYRYRVVVGARVAPPMLERYAWRLPHAFDHELAERAAARFIGRHRFGSFASAGRSQSQPAEELTRDVFACQWRAVTEPMFEPGPGAELWELRIEASGFLPQMVRNIMAAIVTVASGKEPLEWLEYLLVSGDRRLLGAPAPPHGLVLWHVRYDQASAVQANMK
ncbi:MAG TPA: tRNA pseudouridine(38-40) synthase TruA [Thermomicrobiales bacterium]|nr:tRNA pseudouridine(38-40) synthase TruA [Thermomicrobiales bacterium]